MILHNYITRVKTKGNQVLTMYHNEHSTFLQPCRQYIFCAHLLFCLRSSHHLCYERIP